MPLALPAQREAQGASRFSPYQIIDCGTFDPLIAGDLLCHTGANLTGCLGRFLEKAEDPVPSVRKWGCRQSMSTAISPAVSFEKERASPRLPLTIPIVMRGKDSSGIPVIEKTHTVVVNQRGAKVLTARSFTLGASLEIAVPHLKRISGARVAWLGPRDAEVQAIGIDLGRCGDFWGIEFIEAPPAPLGEASDQNQETSPVAQTSANPIVAEHKSGRPRSAPLPDGSPDFNPQLQGDKSTKLLSAVEELLQTAIEQSLGKILPRVNRESEEELQALNRNALEQAQARIHRLVEEAVERLEAQVAEILAQGEKTWQQTLQESTQTSQERLEASFAECQEGLARKAEHVRHELARKLADLSTTLDEA